MHTRTAHGTLRPPSSFTQGALANCKLWAVASRLWALCMQALGQSKGSGPSAASPVKLRHGFPPQEETVTKDCDGCGAGGVPHSIRHVLRRLPRVLVLHLKRFQVRRGHRAQGLVRSPKIGLR